MFLKTNLGYLSQIALENMQLLIQIMIGFPSGPKFIKLKKQCRELKILTSTYKGSYQPMVNIFASKYIRICLTIKFRF